MKKLKELKTRLAKFAKTPDFIIILRVLLTIVGAVLGFILSREEPIPLTEDEINYYTTQVELAYYKGIIYLDDSIIIENNHDGSFNVYDYNHPETKQKLTVTFLEGGMLDVYPYYSYNFVYNRIVAGFLGAFLSLLLTGGALIIIDIIKSKSSKNSSKSKEDESKEPTDKYDKK